MPLQICTLFEQLAFAKRAFEDFRETLARITTAHSASVTVDIRQYHDHATCFELYLDAEVKNARTICWAFELTFTQERLLLDCSVRVNSSLGQDEVRRVTSDRVLSLDDVSQLTEVTGELLQSSDVALAENQII